MEALQREACARDSYWQQQRKREDDFLSDLDSAVVQSLFGVSESNLHQVLDHSASEQISTLLHWLCICGLVLRSVCMWPYLQHLLSSGRGAS